MDGLARKLEIDRHRHQAGPHDAEIGGDKFGPIGRQDCHSVAAPKAPRQQGARDAVRHLVERPVAEFSRRLLGTQIDHRDLVEVAIAADQVTEVLEVGHGPMILAACSVCVRSSAVL